MVAPLWVKPAVLPENVGQSSPIFLGDATPKKNPNHPKICGDRWKDAGYIHNQKFVLPEKVDQSAPNFFIGCYSTKPLTTQNFVVIG